MIGRIPITAVTPTVDCGRFPAHSTVGATIDIGATVFREGHDAVGANVLFRPAGPSAGGRREPARPLLRMLPGAPGTDQFRAQVSPDRIGAWTLQIEAWSDPLSSWRHAVEAKVAAGQDAAEMTNDLATGAALLERIARRPGHAHRDVIRAAAAALRDATLPLAQRIGSALAADLWPVLAADPVRELVTRSDRYEIWVDRPLAEFGAWYEFFPRSAGAQIASDGTPVRHGTFADAADELPRIARMGFDVVYLPPIHPIGEIGRKGRNNAVTAQPGDVGSPWAIGSRLGGHDAVHPALGTLADFDAFVGRAEELGLTVALDLALQCAPDHPWVTEHPEWFTTRPDGSIAYAENPPKKYQDIYPLNFDNDPQGLYREVLRIVEFWIGHGVTVFRVDNPHTKPVNFWQWLIAEVHRTHPEVVFLAEAFTRPAMMHTLAKVGFAQSYTYFTWRTSKAELTDYATELAAASYYMRPNFFVNTPDILHASLAYGGRPMFAIRAVLAATLSPAWGVYSGFELFEDEPVRTDSEEYLNSEKYQLRPRDFVTPVEQGQSLEPLIAQLNTIRKNHSALHHMRGLHFHDIDNDNLLCYSRRDETTGDTLLFVVALDSRGEHWGHTDLTMPALGLGWNDDFDVVDLLSGEGYRFTRHTTIRLEPAVRSAHILHVQLPG
ncbi:MAG: alpha-1,4-glucan--maltose-1-phosphate maltosyltransferase [Actinobacteria bacterium 69-20]|nr:alpha-1,4-glucan--maltose-1-phosphate maltosyltransferase [Actinomycetota bacterium]OJV30126.1 MAG: alpha-1,4-glucan--maltose-1-phosphate maltosyltransferase [Actinobacteria bacterium 69-20]